MNITHILLHNDQLGRISKEKKSGEFTVWETRPLNPSFAEFAKICDAHGEMVKRAEESLKAVTEGLAIGRPALFAVM